jgi:hypothetical protein
MVDKQPKTGIVLGLTQKFFQLKIYVEELEASECSLRMKQELLSLAALMLPVTWPVAKCTTLVLASQVHRELNVAA